MTPGRWARGVAALTAAAAWAALVLQLVLIVDQFRGDGQPVALALWRYLGFFTILTNILVALVATAMAVRPASPMAGARWRFVAAVSIALVGIAYSLLLRWVWDPQGWQAVADHALHDVTPPLFLLAWLLFPHGAIGWNDLWRALAWPAGYFAYAMIRGAADGWYAYHFLDASALPAWALAINVAGLLAGVTVLASLLILLDRRMRVRTP